METQTHQAKASEADLSVGRGGHKVTAGFPVWERVCVCVCLLYTWCEAGDLFLLLSKWRHLFKICNSLQSADNKATSVTLVISERQAGTTEMSERVARVRGCKTCDTRNTEGVLCSFTFWVCLLIITPLWVRTYLPSPRTWCFHSLSDCRIMQKLPWQSSWKSAERCSMDTGKIHRIIHSIEVEVFSNEVWKTWAPSQPYIG